MHLGIDSLMSRANHISRPGGDEESSIQPIGIRCQGIRRTAIDSGSRAAGLPRAIAKHYATRGRRRNCGTGR